ncbi:MULTISPECIES: hypothetical protein [unclassified Uliginosibacterium]|uniref:N-acyl amino acid synthase FeeM domain-containing protein n=1 Tax=unclassified Uliginosibacterium TaxID=2621521 RepID=UPI000C7A3F41|nr:MULTISPECIES: hypothetical protein [unclassified Uliginosibacterium]MDO6386970.1 hypothetical protein [Uliginosibacterium sp. 31-12]PLK49651.1 hypothetical protein C0V76_04265 [Uliginosibacterium sp. TH139]
MATVRPDSTAAKPLRSRLSNPDRHAPEQIYLFEALRELAFETCLEVAGSTLRIGLAASHWQLEQARRLLEQLQPQHPPLDRLPAPELERVVALALHISPRRQRAQGVICLRRDNPAGLQLDLLHRPALDALRARGARLVEVERLAFDQHIAPEQLARPMIQALASTVADWDSTDILAECPRSHAGFYCSQLGFKRLGKQTDAKRLLLCLSRKQLTRLQASSSES